MEKTFKERVKELRKELLTKGFTKDELAYGKNKNFQRMSKEERRKLQKRILALEYDKELVASAFHLTVSTLSSWRTNQSNSETASEDDSEEKSSSESKKRKFKEIGSTNSSPSKGKNPKSSSERSPEAECYLVIADIVDILMQQVQECRKACRNIHMEQEECDRMKRTNDKVSEWHRSMAKMYEYRVKLVDSLGEIKRETLSESLEVLESLEISDEYTWGLRERYKREITNTLAAIDIIRKQLESLPSKLDFSSEKVTTFLAFS